MVLVAAAADRSGLLGALASTITRPARSGPTLLAATFVAAVSQQRSSTSTRPPSCSRRSPFILACTRVARLRRSLNELGDDVIAELPETDTAFGDPARGLESRELRSYLHQAMDRLDENYRLLISLRYQSELSYEEIATMLNLPLGTVKTGLFRAKEQLRRALETYEEPVWTIP